MRHSEVGDFMLPNLELNEDMARGMRFAFSMSTKSVIWHRAGSVSELDGTNHRPMECMHIDHHRGPDYDEPDTGMLVSDIQHLAYHTLFKDMPEEIGLAPHYNDWAINTLTQRIIDWNNANGVDYNCNSLLIEAEEKWKVYFS